MKGGRAWTAWVWVTLVAGASAGRPAAQQRLLYRRDCEPQQVHLALTGDASKMRISWKTEGGGCGAQLFYHPQATGAAPPVQRLTTILPPEEEQTYTADDMCSMPAAGYSFEPPHLHSVVLPDLEPGRRYEYQIGSHEPVRSFQAAAPPAHDAEFRFIVYGDMGESEHRAAKAPGAADTAEHVQREVLEHGADLVLHVGDISYANGETAIWDTFMDSIEPYASAAPYMIAIGNHEYDYRTGGEHRKHRPHRDASGRAEPYDPDWGNYGNDSGGECGVAVTKRFTMPDRAPGAFRGAQGTGRREETPFSRAPFWYSFEYGSAHFAFISTEHDLSDGSDQRQWLEEDLRGVDRCATPWLVVAMHRPMYVPYPHKSNRVVGQHLQDILEDLFLDAEVDLVLTGHVHLYARTCSVAADRCVDSGGITHITLGCGGHKLSDIGDEQHAWVEAAASKFGYGRVTVRDGASLLFEFVRTDDGRVYDSVTLSKRRAERCDYGVRPQKEADADATAPAGFAGVGELLRMDGPQMAVAVAPVVGAVQRTQQAQAPGALAEGVAAVPDLALAAAEAPLSGVAAALSQGAGPVAGAGAGTLLLEAGPLVIVASS